MEIKFRWTEEPVFVTPEQKIRVDNIQKKLKEAIKITHREITIK